MEEKISETENLKLKILTILSAVIIIGMVVGTGCFVLHAMLLNQFYNQPLSPAQNWDTTMTDPVLPRYIYYLNGMITGCYIMSIAGGLILIGYYAGKGEI
jgi:hypothetical protein